MEKRVRDKIKKIEKLEMDLLSDEELVSEKKEISLLINAMQQELLRRIIIIAAMVVAVSGTFVGLLSYPSTPMLFVTLASLLLLIVVVVQYTQKYKIYSDLYKASDILYK